MKKTAFFGIFIRVKNLDQSRAFYRDLLELGEPVIDSSFWVEFQLHAGLRLVLEKSAARYLEHAASATSFICYVQNVERITAKLIDNGYDPQPAELARPGGTFWRCLDPENNLFYLSDMPE